MRTPCFVQTFLLSFFLNIVWAGASIWLEQHFERNRVMVITGFIVVMAVVLFPLFPRKHKGVPDFLMLAMMLGVVFLLSSFVVIWPGIYFPEPIRSAMMVIFSAGFACWAIVWLLHFQQVFARKKPAFLRTLGAALVWSAICFLGIFNLTDSVFEFDYGLQILFAGWQISVAGALAWSAQADPVANETASS